MWHIKLLFAVIVARALASQPEAIPPVAAPLRDLQWAQLNIFHTTDIHGWLAGHLQEYAPKCASQLLLPC